MVRATSLCPPASASEMLTRGMPPTPPLLWVYSQGDQIQDLWHARSVSVN